MHKAVLLSKKMCVQRDLLQTQPACLQTSFFKINPLSNTKKRSSKIALLWLVRLALGGLRVALEMVFPQPTPPLLDLVLFSSRGWFPAHRGGSGHSRHLCQGHPCLGVGLGTAWCAWTSHGAPHHIMHWDRVSFPFLSRAAKKWCRLPFFGERFGEAESKDLTRARSLLRDARHRQEGGRGLGPGCRVRAVV